MKNREGDRKYGRAILSPEQVASLIENIREIQVANQGLNKKTVVEQAFSKTFGDNWPIQAVSSTIARYWKMAFPPTKRTYKRSERSEPPSVKVDSSNTQVMMCPRCSCRFAITIFD